MDYSCLLVKEYTYWLVQVHEDQGYLGRCVLWCKRDGALDFANISEEEREEFFSVLKDIRGAICSVFQADHFNYTFLGNHTNHLHCHVIPRYATKREFAGMTFTDELFGHNPYRGQRKEESPPKILEAVRNVLKEEINNI